MFQLYPKLGSPVGPSQQGYLFVICPTTVDDINPALPEGP